MARADTSDREPVGEQPISAVRAAQRTNQSVAKQREATMSVPSPAITDSDPPEPADTTKSSKAVNVTGDNLEVTRGE